MKQLTCEMCGSTDLLKQDGVFVCQTCGTKYSVEEARKMMIEGTVNVSGTVKVDNTDKIKNYLEMARSAYEAGNKSEAEVYCNRIIEIEPQNYEAWFMKGKAAGWQSTINNVRIEESVQCFSKAIDYADDEKKEIIQKGAADEISELSLALISLACSNFAESPTKSNADSIRTSVINTMNFTLQLLIKCGVEASAYKHQAATKMNNAAISAYTKRILPEYLEERHPPKWRFENYIEESDFCAYVIRIAIRFAEDDYEGNISRYKNLIRLNEDAIKYCGWKSTYSENADYLAAYMRSKGFKSEAVGSEVYSVVAKLNDSEKKKRRKEDSEYREKIDECRNKAAEKKMEEQEKKQAEQETKNEAYWAEHAEEKNQLESELDKFQTELKELESQLIPLEKEIDALKDRREGEVPSEKTKETVMAEISRLRQEQGKLGIFKGKEKKTLQTQIDELIERLSPINESIETERKENLKSCNDKIRELNERAKPIKDKIAATQKQIGEIYAELTKNR